MTVKELIEELKKYPKNTQVFIENYNDFRGLTYLEEPWLDLKEEIKYNNDENRISYASRLKYDGILENVLIIN